MPKPDFQAEPPKPQLPSDQSLAMLLEALGMKNQGKVNAQLKPEGKVNIQALIKPNTK